MITAPNWSADPADYPIAFDIYAEHEGVTMPSPSGESVVIDRLMVPIIAAMWRGGIETTFCCEGGAPYNLNLHQPHERDTSPRSGYLVMRFTGMDGVEFAHEYLRELAAGYGLTTTSSARNALQNPQRGLVRVLAESRGPLAAPGPSLTCYWVHEDYDAVRRLLTYFARTLNA